MRFASGGSSSITNRKLTKRLLPKSKLVSITQEAVHAVLNEIAKTSELRPRAIMHAMSAVLEEADGPIERGELIHVDREFALRALSQRLPLSQEAGPSIDRSKLLARALF